MKRLLRALSCTPQFRRMLGANQVRNNAGGFVHSVGPWKQLDRFLILGSEGGTYYVSEADLTLESAEVVLRCLALDAARTVEAIASISESGRAPSNRPALFALALAFCEPAATPFARNAFTRIVRTGTHLFEFLTAVRAMRGFGRALRGAIADWYVSKPVDALAYQLVKYRQRSGWTHRDALRLAHPKDEERNELFAWACGQRDQLGLPTIVQGFTAARTAAPEDLPALIREYGLTHEMVPSKALGDIDVLRALAKNMPLGALLRFLGRLSASRAIKPGYHLTKQICARLSDPESIQRSRLHPLSILVALVTYANGKGDRGNLEWSILGRVVDALNDGFHHAFANVQPSGKRILVAVDVSGSMSAYGCAGATSLTCAEGATAMALTMAATEEGVTLKAFSDTFCDLPISPRQRLDDALASTSGMAFGGTDCALPMRWARKHRRAFDAFVILTDNETWWGDEHPREALRRYRAASGIDARLVVCAMTPTEFSIADPEDPLSLDVVGFDAKTPQLVSDFIAGRL